MPTWAGKGSMPLFRIRIGNEDQGWTGGSRAAVELLAGDVAQADGSALRLRRLIDRRGDRYVKQLTDPETERLVAPIVDEKLSSHRERGSAKPELRQQLSSHRERGSAKPELRQQPYRRRQARRN
jgi:hypothetical protein